MSSPAEEIQAIEAPAENLSADGFHDPALAKRIVEAALLSSQEPLTLQDMKKMFEENISNDHLRSMLDQVREDWADKSIELVTVASGWRFRVKPEFQSYLGRMTQEKPPRYSRAVMETLAIIAYRQPVTRADIEDIRGVQVSPHILKTLEARGWVDQIGHREVPGRPAIFATTKKFLDDLNLLSLEELPPLDELQMALDGNQPAPMAPNSAQADQAAMPLNDAALAEEIFADDGAPGEAELQQPADTDGDDDMAASGGVLH
jgi:segregation and condensation protein B